MARYVAFLRGVSPMNARMADLRRSFEAAGFANVVTVLSSGNVVFDARSAGNGMMHARAAENLSRGPSWPSPTGHGRIAALRTPRWPPLPSPARIAT